MSDLDFGFQIWIQNGAFTSSNYQQRDNNKAILPKMDNLDLGYSSKSRKWDGYHLKPPIFPISIRINCYFKLERAIFSMLKQHIQQNQPNHVEIQVSISCLFVFHLKDFLSSWQLIISNFSGSMRYTSMYFTRMILLECSTILTWLLAFIGRTNFLSRNVPKQKFSCLVCDRNWKVFQVIPHI